MSALDKSLGLVLLTALCLPASGCKKSGSMATAPDTELADARKAGSQDPLAELDALEGRMLQLGLPVAPAKETAGAPVEDSPDDALAADGEAEGEGAGPAEESEPAPVAMDATLSEGPRRDEGGDRCMDLCGLSESICELEVRICTLSESHDGEAIYADACERAVDDCATAGDACDHCET